MKLRLGSRLFDIFNYAFLGLIALSTLLPFLYIILVSFTDPIEYQTSPIVIIPKHWSLASYEFILSTRTF